MAKCFLCGKETNVEISVAAYNHSAVICGVCAVKKGIIKDPDIANLIREAEEMSGEYGHCIDCKHRCSLPKNSKCVCDKTGIILDEFFKNGCSAYEKKRTCANCKAMFIRDQVAGKEFICLRYDIRLDSKEIAKDGCVCECHEFK